MLNRKCSSGHKLKINKLRAFLTDGSKQSVNHRAKFDVHLKDFIGLF